MGASIMGRSSDSLPPLAIRGGNLRGIDYSLPVASAQVKSCILLAGIFAKGESRVLQPAVTRDHTERMLRSMGAHVITDGLSVTIKPGLLSCVDVRVPGDISSAAFWLVLGACHPNAEFALKGVGVNPTRGGVIQVLKSMGADIRLANQREEGGEPLADISVRSSRLVATTIAGDVVPNVIDEIPVLALAACFAHGTTVIRDAQELRVKESDRIASVAHELSLLGARIYEMPDGMAIQGPAQLKGTVTNSHGDHRLAMTLGVAGALADGQTVVEKAEENSKSYPGFWEDLGRLLTEGV
jgi:3-phosphoshikimate 1-carboxyvinyltransferase